MLRDLDVACEIARDAGAIVLKHYEAGATADAHKDGEPVTIADRESDVFIVDALRQAFPHDVIVSEESVGELTPPPPPDGVDQEPSRIWYVDPMDGTSDFVKRTGDFVVMIGLAVAGWPALGAVYHPLTGTLYRGGHGLPAESIVGDRRTELRVSQISEPAEARLVVSRSHTPDIIVDIAERLGIEHMEKCGSVGLKAARVAEGAGELYLHPSVGTKLWDTCAPEAILVAAGGAFSDCNGRPLVYGGASLHNNSGICASNGRLHDAALAELEGLL